MILRRRNGRTDDEALNALWKAMQHHPHALPAARTEAERQARERWGGMAVYHPAPGEPRKEGAA